jgi:hypothetical protein
MSSKMHGRPPANSVLPVERGDPEHTLQKDLPALSARARMSFQRCRIPGSLRAQGLAGDEAY